MGRGLKSVLRNPVFVVAAVLFSINFVLDRTGPTIPFVHSYLDDLLFLPLSLGLILLVQRAVTFRNTTYVLPWWQIIAAFAFFTVWFEWYLPQQSERYTGDWWDVLAYALGGALFVWRINVPGRKPVAA